MTSIQQIIEEFKSFYESNTEEISLNEMKKKLAEIYKKNSGPTEKKEKKVKNDDGEEKKAKKAAKKKEDEGKEEKKKREPTAYNLFMREKMAELKDDKDMSGKDKMKKIAEMWSQREK